MEQTVVSTQTLMPDRAGPESREVKPARLRAEGKYFARGGQTMRIKGVTYGPFAPNARGEQFPAPERVADDFALMQAIGVNAIRTYHLPPEWFLDLADESGVGIFLDVPWAKHTCFLESTTAQREARETVTGP